ncbi:hypothetical protein SAMN05192585_13821 [Acetanaerobacterium elongatum]|uniref:Uncharacterized protein n=1 Tax=Acetanaerobacterium elongatum TaxID=258515 RepID=A0A1H0F6V9_9FIRM|nr:hypothetical protein SAMN05192585_13821 [Acetanaerobacterium elongatum]
MIDSTQSDIYMHINVIKSKKINSVKVIILFMSPLTRRDWSYYG